MANINEVTVTGYANNIKTFESGVSSFGLSVGTKIGEDSDGNAQYRNGFINVVTKQEVADGEKVTVKGFLTFDFWEDKETGKERQAAKIFAMEVGAAETNVNELTVTGYANNVRTFESGVSALGLSVGTKVGQDADGNPEYRNGFVNVVTKQEVESGDKIVAKGFLSFDFWEDKETGKERQAAKIFATGVEAAE